MSLLLLLIMKSNTLLLLYMGSGEHLCLLSFNPKKSMSLHLEDKGSLFFLIDGIGLVLVLNTVTKWGKILVNCNLILFYFLSSNSSKALSLEYRTGTENIINNNSNSDRRELFILSQC